MRMLLTCLVLTAGVAGFAPIPAVAQSDSTLVSTPPPAPKPARAASAAGPFARGNVRGGLYGGAGNTLGNTYFIIGGGLGYYVYDGLEVGADFEGWLFQDPRIWKLSPQVRYTVWQLGALRPYVGAFWRRTWVGDPFDDFNSWGGRFGLVYAKGRGFAGVGMVYERYDTDVDGDNDIWYPEVSFSVYF